MTDPARYKRATELFAQAVDLPREERSSYLQKQCGNDSELFGLLESLLREDEIGPTLTCSGAPHLANEGGLSGRTVSHYLIDRPIAAGGMGIVYRATDTRLQRPVVLKFLPPFLIADRTIRERFLREARAIASIDHQNVCPVYEVDEADGLIFIAMACLEGATLDERLKHGRLPVEEAVAIALQTARGLEAAHAKGIVHRDIKPANLMLMGADDSGHLVRILDFGIAQWAEGNDLTRQGMSIGTMSYIAPEQVAGSRVDGRADIWSLGVVLYEMISGRLPFVSRSLRQTLAAIAGPAPADLSPIRKVASKEIVSVVRKALEKDPNRRYQNTAAFISDLEDIQRDGSHSKRKRTLRTAAAMAALAGTIAIFVFTARKWATPARTDVPKIVPFTFYPGYQQDPAISPDARQIAFAGQGKDGINPLEIYVQLIGSADPLRLTRVPPGSFDHCPVWDANGTRVAFLRTPGHESVARVLLVPALGGAAADIGLDGVLSFGGLAWSPNGETMAFARMDPNGRAAVFEMSLADRTLRQRSYPSSGESDCCPRYDPGGSRLAFKRNDMQILIVNRGSERARIVTARSSWPGLAWTSDGASLVYSSLGSLMRVRVAKGSATQPAIALGSSEIYDVAIRGKQMAFVRWDFEHSIWTTRLTRTQSGGLPRIVSTPSVQLFASTMREDSPQFSPDGEWIAFASKRSGTTDIWIGRRNGADLRRLTFLEGDAGTPRWSPDGNRIAFDLSPPSLEPGIWTVPAAGGVPHRVALNAQLPSWSHDGRAIYYYSRSDGQIWKVPAQGGAAIRITRHGGFESFESADGRYLYYSKGNDDGAGIWRVDLGNSDEARVPELSDTGDYRQWTMAPSGIYFIPKREAFSNEAALHFFDFATQKTVRVGVVGRLVTAGPGAIAVSRDETCLLYVRLDRDNRNIMLAETFR